jgi:hypothetical protein
LIGCYFLAALAFSVFRILSDPFFAQFSTAAISQAVVGSLVSFTAAGFPALLLWAFHRPSSRYALWPMLSWAFLGIATAFSIEAGARLERDVQVSTLARNLALSDSKLSCLDTEHASKFKNQFGIADREIFCLSWLCFRGNRGSSYVG